MISKQTIYNHKIEQILYGILLSATLLFSQDLEYYINGQFTGWLTVNPEIATQIGGRYIPAFNSRLMLSDETMADLEASVNLYGFSSFKTLDKQYGEGDLRPYRVWGRVSGTAWEARLGLQKINFGTALILRPLMWFDSIDPRDPIQLTEGVYALLGKYYFPNNANAWLWILYGNEDPRGFDPFHSAPDEPEVGGRLQFPFLTGEIAFSTHYRTIDLQNNVLLNLMAGGNRVDEIRYGLDGKWDVEVGLWLEAAVIDRDFNFSAFRYQKLVTIGVDYTFALGNGLHVSAEHLITETSGEIFTWGEAITLPIPIQSSDVTEQQSLSAISVNYPFGLIDNLMIMLYSDWQGDQLYSFINWERKFDSWSIYFMGFWNPDEQGLYQGISEINLFAGKGIQIMFVYNH